MQVDENVVLGPLHVPFGHLDQTPGLRHHDDGGARRVGHRVVPAAGDRRVSRRHLPRDRRADAVPGRVARSRRPRAVQADRGSAQHRAGCARGDVHVHGRGVARQARVPARHRRHGRAAGRAGQGVAHPPAAPAQHRGSGRRQVRPQRPPDHVGGHSEQRALAPRDHRSRR